MRLLSRVSGVLAIGLFAGELLAQSNVAEQYLLFAANQERAAFGIAPLVIDRSLEAAALRHAELMAKHREISHQFAGEAELSERGSSAGAHFSLISENVAEAPTAVIVHDAWMRSQGHRENLLDPRVDAIGIAVVSRGRQLYAVQDFARTTQALSFGQQEAEVAMLLDRQGLGLVPENEDAHGACATASGSQFSSQPTFVMRYTTSNLGVLPSQLTSRLQTSRYSRAAVGACEDRSAGPFSAYRIAILLYP